LTAAFLTLVAAGALGACGESDDPTPAATGGSGRDCGTVVAEAPRPAPMSCFDAAFAGCSPARVLVDNRGAALAGTKVRYAIRSRSGANCVVRWSYVALPANPSWVGKDIECAYAPGADFQAALAARGDFAGCSGPLLTLIRG
jgi:hypothetical protein